MAYKKIDREEIKRMLRKRKGTRSGVELAAEIKVTPSYLYDVLSGAREPGPSILNFLGLEKHVTTTVIYKRVAA